MAAPPLAFHLRKGTTSYSVPQAQRLSPGHAVVSVTETDNQLEVLARSGGFQVTVRIELLEPRSDTDDLREPSAVRIAGMKQHAGAEHIRVGDALELVREPANAFDAHATMIVAAGEKAGYLPRPYSVPRPRALGEEFRAASLGPFGLRLDQEHWLARTVNDFLGLRAIQ